MEKDPERSKLLQSILELLVSAGYFRARISSLSPFDKLTGGLAWCIAASNSDADFDILYDDDFNLGDKIKVGEVIERALRSMECPYPLQAHQIQGLDYKGVYPVVQWIVSRVLTMRAELGDELRRCSYLHFQNHFDLLGEAFENGKVKETSTICREMPLDQPKHLFHQESYDWFNLMPYEPFNVVRDASVQHCLGIDKPYSQHSMEVPTIKCTYNLDDALSALELGDGSPLIQEEESSIHLLEKEITLLENSIEVLRGSLTEQDHIRGQTLSEVEYLHQRIDKEGAKNVVEKLILLLELLQSLDREESDFRSYCKQKRSEIQAEVIELEKEISSGEQSKSSVSDMDHSLLDSLQKLDKTKKDLGAKLRAILLLKRRLDDVPSQTELIQYERRFAELYVQIQEKLQQTRKYYATYNALMEIKELTLKETSLMNSINSQFQDAMTSTSGRTKLIDSMEGIMKATQQKLEKLKRELHAEEKNCTALKETYATAIAEQRHCSTLLKAFQDECAKNEKLRSILASG